MSRNRVLLLTLAMVVGLFQVTPAEAQDNGGDGTITRRVPLPTDGTWSSFNFGDVGSITGPLEFNGAGILDIADCCLSGDQFRVYDNGVPIGLTSTPTTTGDSVGDYDTACSDPRWSSASFPLGAGSHSITIAVVASPFGSGSLGARFPGGGCGAVEVPTLGQYGLAALAALLVLAGLLVLRRRLA